MEINWLGFAYRFIIGKSATPFYYIVVLIQLTIITPWLVKVIEENRKVKILLWFITPVYLICLYIWNFAKGSSPQLYETLFPAWFGFYYLGIQVRCGLKLKCSGYMVVVACLISCVEALVLRSLATSLGFYTSQITIGSFLYSVAVIGWVLNRSERHENGKNLIAKIGDCSYGIFYVHMAVLIVIGRFIDCKNWFEYWSIRLFLTATISFGIVFVGQRLLKKQTRVLKYIGFI